MPTYLDRYLAGEHEAVWRELTALGSAIRNEPLVADAYAVAHTTMTRARANIAALVQRLTALGYQFTSEALGKPPTPYVPPDERSLDRMRELERRYGALPLSIEAWYEIVGAVDFIGAYPRLSAYEAFSPSDMVMSFQGQPLRVSVYPEFRILGPTPVPEADPDAHPTSDPLVVWPCIEALVDEGEDERYSLGFAPDSLGKANASGGDGPHLHFGDAGMDAPLHGDDWEGVPFVTCLRTAFAWGGFPGLREAINPPRDVLAQLCNGLLAF